MNIQYLQREKVSNFKIPINLLELRSVIGTIIVLKKFILEFNMEIKPLLKILKKETF